MELVEHLDRRACKTGKKSFASWGLFFCPFCKKNVEKVVSAGLNAKSCGCARFEILAASQTKHGLSKHPLYNVWAGMIRRCEDSTRNEYINYGGRGIRVCDEWRRDFKLFFDWCIKQGWEKGLHIDREDNNKNYFPDNCRIITLKENNRNRPLSKLSMKKADEIRTKYKSINVSQSVLAKEFGVCQATVWAIINNKIWT